VGNLAGTYFYGENAGRYWGLAGGIIGGVVGYQTAPRVFNALDNITMGTKIAGASVEGAGKTTAADWTGKTSELAKTSPVKIPENATIKAGTKTAGYDQINYKWSENGYIYEARWHTKTPGAPAGQGNTWVVERITPGTSTGQMRVTDIKVGETWVTRTAWQNAIKAYQNGTMTAAQEAMLKAGHWLAP